MDKFRDKQFLSGMFLEESREQIENMEVKVIEIEFSPYNSENMDALMRIAHSIKGASKTMEYHVMSRLAHYFENIIASEMDEEARFGPDVIKRLLKILDIMKKNWQKISVTKGMEELFIDFETIFDDDAGGEQEFEIEDDEIEAISQIEEDRGYEADEADQAIDEPWENEPGEEENTLQDEKALTNEEIELSKMVSKYKSVYKLLIYFHEKSKTKSVKMFLVINNLVGIGDILRVNPENYENLTDEKIGDYFSVILATNSPNEEIRENVNVISEIDKVDIVRIRKGLELEDKKNLDYSHIAHMSRREDMLSVRVNISKIDELLNLMGEFVIDREKLNTLSRHMKNKYKDIYEVKILSDVLKSINNISKEIQSKIISVRMLPLDYIFSRFHRFVRSTAEEYKKDIKFTISGEDIEVDRSIIEKLLDPLNHILRNAIDHGIETIEERVQKGKSKEGKISISAKAKGNNIVIEVEDDGRGIDLDKIKSKIIEEYSIENDKLDGISENNIIKYIFNQGFSTSENIDEISGRGIGLDIVNRAIGNLNGIIDIETEKDRGTKFIIKLPMTLAIMKALLVVEGGIKFAIPTSNILDVLILKEREIEDKIYNLSGEEFFDWRDQESIPLVRFSEYFDIKQGRGADMMKKMHIVVIGYSERRVALAVEGLWREQEIVVKSLDDFRGEQKLLGTLDGISGISVLGDGSFSRVIDILSIVEG